MALPCHMQALRTQQQFEAAGLGPGSYDDAVLSAHEALGLVTAVGPLNDRHASPALHAPGCTAATLSFCRHDCGDDCLQTLCCGWHLDQQVLQFCDQCLSYLQWCQAFQHICC